MENVAINQCASSGCAQQQEFLKQCAQCGEHCRKIKPVLERERVGVLIAQLGTPEAPTAAALRPYLRQFLSDRRVIEVNRLLWFFILNAIVLPFRPKRSARLYSRIWGKEGSPLLTISEQQTQGFRERLAEADVSVELGMRYGNPSIPSALDKLLDAGVTRLIIFPMYPQYAAATTASTYDAVFEHLQKRRWVPTVSVVPPYHRHAAYVSALADSINEHIAGLAWKPQALVLSYHGIPRAYIEKGDPYCCSCVETTKQLKPLLKLDGIDLIHTYQSRFGRDPWLEPYTSEVFEKLPSQGVKNIVVAAPGFTTDCLETLDELGNEGKHQFTEAGGDKFSVIPCLNTHSSWMSAMEKIATPLLKAMREI